MNRNRFSFLDILDTTFIGRLKLREKLTLGNMFITILVVVLIGVFIFLRNQFSSGQLTTQLEQNIRTRVEQSLLTTGREQSALLGVFFSTMSRNTSVIGSTVEDTFAQRSLLADGTYWDARESLSRLPSGSWDNPNSEISSIFIPAEVEITNSLAAKLNTLKYTELVFPSILADNPDIIAIYFGGVTRETIYYPNIDLAAIVPPDFDVTGRLWYVNAAPENNPERDVVWSTPYQDAALNGLVITASIPVFNEREQFQGVAAMDVQLLQITTLVSNIRIGNTGYAFLVDDSNRLIALPDAGYTDFNITDEIAKLGEIMDPAVLPAAAPQFFEILEKIAAGDEGVFSTTINDTERYVAFQQVPEVGYKLVLVVPAEELLTEAELVRQQITSETGRTITISLLLIAAILVAATIGSLAIGNRFTQPLESLTQVAKEITAGNFDARAEVRSQDEIGTLANTLNTMTSSLKEAIQSLEQRVQERTAALKQEQEKSERRARQYEVIAKVAQTITTTQNLLELLPQITQVISEKFGFYHVGIFLMDPANQYAVLGAANSEGGRRMLNRGHQLRVGQQGIVGYVTGTGKARIALDVGEDAVFFNNPDLPETRSEMALPLTIAGTVIGALDVQSTEPNAFTVEDVEVLTTLADQVSVAIQNAQSYEQIQKSLAEAEAVSRRYFSETWSQIAQEQRVTGYRYTVTGTIPIEDTGNGSPTSAESPDKKQVTVPIIIRGRTVGELSVLVPKQEQIRMDHMNLIHAVADRVGIFAENARLFDQTSRRAERERLVSDISNKIRSTNDPREMLETAIRELRQALNVSHIEIIPQKITSPDR
ncbi:MAG: hypothetical protein DPW18_09200 [Chloroflexi bacterium]|nr:hypothetical protein [Chloroflexota bacterium]MDL1941616.1 HAMP domain-containing protein [Chloroflexi bacterium CFX2]